jgi:inorganic pyrophosphatase
LPPLWFLRPDAGNNWHKALISFLSTMSNLKHLPIGPSSPDVVHAVIEIPKGSRNKIEYEEDLEAFKLDRVLFAAVHYPVAYGFIPSTHWDDGDPLDILVITNEPLATGIVLDVIPIGALELHDDKGDDLKIISVAAFDPNVNMAHEITDLQKHRRIEIEHFFSTYKLLESKEVKTGDWLDAETARKAIMRGTKEFEKLKSKKSSE